MTLLRRFVAFVTALALAAAAVLVIVEAVGVRVDESPVLLPIDEWEQRLTGSSWARWDADAWTYASGATLAVGVLLVVLQLIPHRTTTLPRGRDGDDREVHFGRSGLDERLRDVAVDQDGVLGASVRVKKRRVRVQANIPSGGDTTSAERSVRDAVREDLGRLRLAKKQRVRVSAEPTDTRVI